MSSPDLIAEVVKPLERDLGLREGFFKDLQNEDDWSFIIKGHAFLEAVFTNWLSKVLERKELKDVFANIELNDQKTGKVAFAQALGLLTPEERRFLRHLSELRNRLVHDVTQTSFDLDEYVASMDHNQRRSFEETFSLSPRDAGQPQHAGTEPISRYVLESPKEAIWVGIMAISAKMHFGPNFPIFFVLIVILRGWLDSLASDDSSRGEGRSSSA